MCVGACLSACLFEMAWALHHYTGLCAFAAGIPSPHAPSEEHQAPTLLKSLSSKLMRSMRRSSGEQSQHSLQLTTQMSNLGPNRQEGEAAGAVAIPVALLAFFSKLSPGGVAIRLNYCCCSFPTTTLTDTVHAVAL